MRPPDVEMYLPAMLRPSLPEGTYVGRKAPAQRRPYMVTIRRQGGPTRRFMDYPRIGINLWAPSDTEVNNLAATVTEALNALEGKGQIKTMNVYGMVEVPEASELTQRYLTADLSVRTV